jgi:hypothetical protein
MELYLHSPLCLHGMCRDSVTFPFLSLCQLQFFKVNSDIQLLNSPAVILWLFDGVFEQNKQPECIIKRSFVVNFPTIYVGSSSCAS